MGALVGLGIEGEEGLDLGVEAGAQATADGVDVFSDEDRWDVLEQVSTSAREEAG